ncbi:MULTISPECIES: DinB family protein [unclassified Aureispira]|uniref:DinB family protein n=1 Tax=unclassified Aureispira TaxID=2649989 RepID=UPI0006983FA7|nr:MULTISPECIES: DinB family protein [unclassified Aureispira]WMX17256.1 DinB family protein [Aureispira sp. CCB-E]
MNKEYLKLELEKSKQTTLQFFNLPLDDLDKRYAPGKWTIRQILHHLADAETILYERIRRVISGPQQVLWVFDQDRFCEQLNYDKFPLEINKDIFNVTRRAMIYVLEQHYDDKKALTFIHSKTGKRTLGDEFEKVAWHNEHHLNQIRQALKFG